MNRREFLSHYGAPIMALPLATFSYGASTQAQTKPLKALSLRGSIDATKQGVKPNSYKNQSRVFQKVLDQAAAQNKAVFLPAGTYVISNIKLPPHTRLFGTSKASRIIYAGNGPFISAIGSEHITMRDIIFDGANHSFNAPLSGLLNIKACPDIIIKDCDFTNSAGAAISLDACAGRIENNNITQAYGVAGLYALNSKGLSIQNNKVADCANGGILVHRSTIGADGSIITGNRIERIAAQGGGTGQRGNGINLFRTNNVLISNNHISDCAFSAIRANSASNAQISNNICLRSGETALYAEFSFQGSIISNNIVDGATMGVSIANFNEGGRLAICANNLIRNLTLNGPYKAEVAGFGIGIFAEADTSVTGNVIENAPKYGIGLGWGPYLRNVTTTNNIIRHARIGIAVSVVKGTQSTLIANNIFDGMAKGAIIGHEWTKAVTKDLAFGNNSPFKHLTLNNNQVKH